MMHLTGCQSNLATCILKAEVAHAVLWSVLAEETRYVRLECGWYRHKTVSFLSRREEHGSVVAYEAHRIPFVVEGALEHVLIVVD